MARYRCIGGSILNDANQVIEPNEATILLDSAINAADLSTNRAVIRDQLATARSLAAALVEALSFALCVDNVVRLRPADHVRAMLAASVADLKHEPMGAA